MVIGLTGRTGSGCSTVAGVLAESDFTKLRSEYKEFRSGIIDNNVRKNRIVYNFMKEHWRPFTIIKASDVIFYYALLLDNFNKFSDNLFCASESDKVNNGSKELIAKGIRKNISDLSDDFNDLHKIALECDDYLNSKTYRSDLTKSDLTKIDLYKRKHSIASMDVSMKSNTFALQNIKQRIWQAVKILKGYWNFTTRSQRQVEYQLFLSVKGMVSFTLSLRGGTRTVIR